MANPIWFRRTARWFACTGALALPACAGMEPPAPVAPLSRVGVNAPPPARPKPPPRAGVEPGEDKPSPGGVVPASATATAPTTAPPAPAPADGKPLPIDLPTALTLADASPIDVQVAAERLRAAAAEYDRAKVMWLPNIGIGIEYYGHAGRIQDIIGTVFPTDRQSLSVGVGPNAVFATGDALYAPLAARQVLRAREADARAAKNDAALQVAEAYFNVQQARGEVAAALDTLRRAEELVRLTEKVAPDLAPTVEVNRAKTEAARRRLAVESAYERWQTASADLTRLLRLEAGTVVEPTEEPSLVVELTDPAATPADLIPVALTHRPELAADQALIQAALARVKQEKARPYLPNIAVRGMAGQQPGLAGGLFGGGIDGDVGNFGARFSIDLQAIWEVQNLGFGNRASVRSRQAEERTALLQLLRTQDLVTAEVVQAHAQVRRSANRLKAAADGVADAAETAEKNLRGLVPGKRVGDQLTLVFRPQEAVAAVAALDQAYRDYYSAIADHNRAQFRLRRALGNPTPVAPADPVPNEVDPGSPVPPAAAAAGPRQQTGFPRPVVPAPVSVHPPVGKR